MNDSDRTRGGRLPPPAPAQCPSDLVFDQDSSGELTDAQQEVFKQHMKVCARCQAHQAKLETLRSQFLAAAPTFPDHAKLVDRPIEPTNTHPAASPGRWGRITMATLAAAALVMIIAQVNLYTTPPADTRESANGAREKGSASVQAFLNRRGRVTRIANGGEVAPGDELRFTYTMSRDGYLAILGWDGHTATTYLPAIGTQAVPVTSARDRALDFAVELDATGSQETFVAVFCEAPQNIAPLLGALRSARSMRAPSGCHLDTSTLYKSAPK